MRKTVPVVVVGGLAVLIASQFVNINIGWKDPSTPLSEQVENKTEQLVDAVEDGVDSVKKVFDPEATSSALDQPENAYVGMNLVDVLIDEDDYLLLTGDSSNTGGLVETDKPTEGARKNIALYEVVRLAKILPGEKSGIKVRIWRTAEATAEAEKNLLAALRNGELTDDQIDFRRRLVE